MRLRMGILPALLIASTLLTSQALLAQARVDEVKKPPEKKPSPIKNLQTLKGAADWVTSVCFSPDGKLLAAGSFDEVAVFAVKDWKLKTTLSTRTGYARDLLFTKDNQHLLVAGYQSISIWDVQTGEKLQDLREQRSYVTGLAFSPDETLLASSSEDGSICIWSMKTKEVTNKITRFRYPAQSVAFSSDGKRIASANGDLDQVIKPGLVHIFDAETGQELKTFKAHEKAAKFVAFTPDDKYLLSTSQDEKVNLYALTENIIESKPHGFFAEHGRPTNAAVFAANGKLAISVSGGRAKGKNEMKIWSIPDGQEKASLEAHQEKITDVAIAPDGITVATASYDQTVNIWNISKVIANADNPAKPAEKPAEDDAVE